jgi:hypothetical protein
MANKKKSFTISPLYQFAVENEAVKYGVTPKYIIELALFDRYFSGDVRKMPKIQYERTSKTYDL